uniref:F-box domain-containing protein n=1 Tax=Angiostrongylus cantonensis TaxID=6313 RepID=A0A0K0DAM9_ANGCA
MLSSAPTEGMLVWLPSELLLLIFSHIRGRHLLYNVRLVCKKFHSLLANQHWWLSRIQVSSLCIAARLHQHFDAARSFVMIEEELHRWKSWYQLCFSLIVSGHIATIDAIRLFSHGCRANMFCLSGGRDRAIKLWNIGDLQPKYFSQDFNAHRGWIWCLDQSTCSPDHFLSCSWDCTVKMWQITPTNIFSCQAIESAKLGSACMCLSSTQNGLAACSTFAKKKRTPIKLCAIGFDNVVYSCGEDRRIVVVDIRNSNKPISEMVRIFYRADLFDPLIRRILTSRSGLWTTSAPYVCATIS